MWYGVFSAQWLLLVIPLTCLLFWLTRKVGGTHLENSSVPLLYSAACSSVSSLCCNGKRFNLHKPMEFTWAVSSEVFGRVQLFAALTCF